MQMLFIRHGKTKGNEEKRYVGSTELDLSELGIAEIQKITYPAADLVFASPRVRCQQTAKLIYPHQQIITVEGLCEMQFGAFEGKNYEELKDDIRYQQWLDSDGTMACPGGESRETFAKRCVDAFWQTLQNVDLQNISTIAFVVHGGTIMGLMDKLTKHNGHYYDFMVDNAHGYICDFNGKNLIITAKI